MIRYDLTCSEAHSFEAWFSGMESFDEQSRRGLLSCPHCGTAKVEKAIMAPNVARRDKADAAPVLSEGEPAAARQAMRELRRKMLEGSEDVGVRFAQEAGAMYRGEKPSRTVHGRATPDEIRELVDEGVPLAAIPEERRGN